MTTTNDADGPAAVARKEFARRLRDLRDAAGAKNADVVTASGRMAGRVPGGRTLTPNTVSRLLSAAGVKAPDWDVVAAFVEACRVHAGVTKAPVPPARFDLGDWKAEHTALVRALEAAAGSPASAPTDEEPDPRDVETAVAAYAERARETWGHLDLEVLLPLDDQGRHPEIRLREVFVEPSVRADPPPVELPRELVRRLVESGELPESEHLPSGTLDALKDLRGAYEKRPTLPVLQVLGQEDTRKCVLLGDPGAGKSTLAKYLALTQTLADRVGVIVELRQYAEPQWCHRNYEDFLAHRQDQFGMCVPPPVLRHLLRTGRAVVIFDGLDEVFDPKVRQAASEQIAAFAARWPEARIVVTSRAIGYKRHVFDGADFTHYMLQDLDREQIATFTERWYTLSAPDDTEKAALLAQRLQDAVRDSRPIRELSGNPLLLTILAIVGRRQALPKDRIGVYRQAVTVLTAQWDQQAKHLEAALPPAIKDVLDGLDRQEMLMTLAHAMQAGTHGIAGNRIHGDDLAELLRTQLEQHGLPPAPAGTGAQALVSQLRERNFILARYGGEVYGFVHRAFLEHLAAADIYQRYTRGREWTPQELLDEVIAPHAHDPAWHEVLLLFIGQLEPVDAAAAIDRLLDLHDSRDDLDDSELLEVAIRALAEVRRIGMLNEQSKRVVAAMTEVLNYGWGGSFGPAAHSALASFGEYWVGREAFLRWFRTRGQFSPDVDTPRIVCLFQPSPAELIRFARHAHSGYDRMVFVRTLAESWEHDTEVRAFLFELADSDESGEVRRTALTALCEHPLEARELRALLVGRARADRDSGMRRVALLELARHWRDDAEVRAVFSAVAQDDTAESAQWTALWALADVRPAGIDARPLLRELLLRQNVRLGSGASSDAVVERWAVDIGPQLPLMGVEDFEELPVVLLQLLAEERPGDVDVRALLIAWSASDEDYAVQYAAMRELAEQWQWDPEIRDLFMAWAQGDASPTMRRPALDILRTQWLEDEPIHMMLLDLAVQDEDMTARSRARAVLVNRWRLNTTERARLFDIAREGSDWAMRLDALRVMADRWPTDAEVRGLLFDLERTGAGAVVLGVLAQRWPMDDEVHRLLFARAGADGDLSLREEALILLVSLRSDPEVRSLLMDLARCDADVGMRSRALLLSIVHWPGDAEVRALVQERAGDLRDGSDPYAEEDYLTALRLWQRDDEDSLPLFFELVRNGLPQAREGALEVLADSRWEDAEVRTLVMGAVREDPDDGVRATALKAVAGHWADPEVRELIAEVAHGAPPRMPEEAARCVLALADVTGPGAASATPAT
ncbi:NACHT domain-containing protein [Streptomyces sp. NPDC102360]|uniref:NACHT domain-containing protein n=1 Tax=Streptomyces sp. NPDC102360 TaxID=3366160 RepID=UPI00381B50E5